MLHIPLGCPGCLSAAGTRRHDCPGGESKHAYSSAEFPQLLLHPLVPVLGKIQPSADFHGFDSAKSSSDPGPAFQSCFSAVRHLCPRRQRTVPIGSAVPFRLVVRGETFKLFVRELDAIDGMPVLDIKPVMAETCLVCPMK